MIKSRVRKVKRIFGFTFVFLVIYTIMTLIESDYYCTYPYVISGQHCLTWGLLLGGLITTGVFLLIVLVAVLIFFIAVWLFGGFEND